MPAPGTRSISKAARPVTLDLDKLAREKSFEPFTIRAGGEVIELIDAKDLDWQVTVSLSPERMQQFFAAVVKPDDYETFLAAKFETWKMEKLLELYRDHFGLGDQGN